MSESSVSLTQQVFFISSLTSYDRREGLPSRRMWKVAWGVGDEGLEG